MAPVATSLYGREKERGKLERWVKDQSCRVVAVLGIGGTGKSALVATVATHLKENFECIFWRSLQAAPPAGVLLKQCLGLLSRQLAADLPQEVDDLLPLLLAYLRGRRCLLVLDNLESIMQAGQRAGCYREGYAAYGKLIRLFAETRHQSCLMLTSREKPKEVVYLEGIRSLSLAGIGPSAGWELLKERGLSGSKRDWAAFIERYSGNPLALQLASEPVREVFGGSIARFLQEDVSAFGEINDLLGQHFHRLSGDEREILFWLAIERGIVRLEELRELLAHPMPAATLLEVLDSLRRRSMIETTGPAHFTMQAVFKEYVTGCLIERAYQEFLSEIAGIWMSHALTRAKNRDSSSENQPGPLLASLAERLLATLGKRGIEQKAKSLLTTQRRRDMQHRGYLAENILNLLNHAGCSLRGLSTQSRSRAFRSDSPQYAGLGEGGTMRELVSVEN